MSTASFPQHLLIIIAGLLLYTPLSADELHDAATAGNLPRVQELIKANPSLISAKDAYQETPLISAAEYGRRDVVEWLLQNGADIEGGDNNNETALGWAASQGHADIVELLLQHGAKVDVRRNQDLTPLIMAANKDVAELLVAHGADVNAEDEDGDSPLAAAEYSKNADRNEWINLLLAHGAKVNLIRLPGLWLWVHAFQLIGAAAAAVTLWLCIFWPRRKVPAPSWIVRLAWWFGIYLIGGWTVVVGGIWCFGFSRNPMLFVVEPFALPVSLRFLLPDAWMYWLFGHLPEAVVSWSLFLIPVGTYLLHLVLSLRVKRLQTFCALLVLLVFLVGLSAFGLAECIANFPHPD